MTTGTGTIETTTTFRVRSFSLDRVKDNFDKLVKRAAKLGVPPATMSIGPLVEVKSKDEFTGRVKISAYYDITVSVEPVSLGGWTLVAALDHIENGVITRVVPGLDLPVVYRTAGPDCDHCRINRKRNTTYVLLHEDGRYSHVGSTCLGDFLGMSPAKLVAAGTYLRAVLGFGDDEGYSSGGRSDREHTGSFLALVARLIEVGGWVSKKAAREDPRKVATADNALNVIYLAETSGDSKDKKWANEVLRSVGETHNALAVNALGWVRGMVDAPDLNDYFTNLTVLTVGDSFDKKYAGLVASLVAAYSREMGLKAERALAPVSTHVGEMGERIPIDLTVYSLKHFDGNYGVRTLVLFTDPAGNRLKWWTGETDLEVGSRYTGKATVKEHEVFNGLKATVITRAAVARVEVAG